VALRGEAKCGRQRREKEGSEAGVGAVTRAYACVCAALVVATVGVIGGEKTGTSRGQELEAGRVSWTS
jgi:hypothetical protein